MYFRNDAGVIVEADLSDEQVLTQIRVRQWRPVDPGTGAELPMPPILAPIRAGQSDPNIIGQILDGRAVKTNTDEERERLARLNQTAPPPATFQNAEVVALRQEVSMLAGLVKTLLKAQGVAVPEAAPPPTSSPPPTTPPPALPPELAMVAATEPAFEEDATDEKAGIFVPALPGENGPPLPASHSTERGMGTVEMPPGLSKEFHAEFLSRFPRTRPAGWRDDLCLSVKRDGNQCQRGVDPAQKLCPQHQALYDGYVTLSKEGSTA